jgi:hypothetical protein
MVGMNRFARVRQKTGLSAYGMARELLKRDVIKGVDHYYKIERGEIAHPTPELENGFIEAIADLTGASFNDVLISLRGVDEVSA